ncbi:MAG: response regulator [Gemmatimonas sp.]
MKDDGEGPSAGETMIETLRKRRSILLVDDDPAFLSTAQQALTAAGYTVTTATRFLDAVDILDTCIDGIDAVIADLVLDKGNGLALGRMARFSKSEVRTIYISGYDIVIDEEIGSFLRKPVAPEALVRALDDAFGIGPTAA